MRARSNSASAKGRVHNSRWRRMLNAAIAPLSSTGGAGELASELELELERGRAIAARVQRTAIETRVAAADLDTR